MKKIFAFSLVLIMMLAVFCAPVGAAEAAGVDIWVDILNGGTAVVVSEINCPLPDKSRLTLEAGQSEAFHINFTEEGTYSYLVKVEPDERKLTFDDTVYNIKVLVSEDNGKLHASILIYNTKTGNKYAPENGGKLCTVSFSNSKEPPALTNPTETASPSETTKNGDGQEPTDHQGGKATEQTDHHGGKATGQTDNIAGSSPDGSGNSSKPQTGDDSRLNFYLLLAILASAGLFMLSVFYYRSVLNEIKQKYSG